MIDDIEDDNVLEISSQEPSMSSKYPMNDPPSLYTSIRDINMKLLGFYPWCQTGSFDANDDPKKVIQDIEDDPGPLTSHTSN